MNNAPPSAQESFDSPSSKDASRIAAFKSTSPRIGIAEDSLLRTILDEHVEILNFASSQFLDHAMALRLRTIGAKDLVSMLAKAERLGYERDVISDDEADDETVQATHETPGRARSRVDTTDTSTPLTPPSERVGQRDSDPTESPQASLIGREKKRLEENRHMSPLVEGSHRKTPVRPSTNVLQRQRRPPGIRKSCGPQRHGASPYMRHYQGPSTHGIEVVVISDSEPDD